jgi:hypothetical protein
MLVLISGCAEPSPGGGGPDAESRSGPGLGTYGPDDLVLRVELAHGFMPDNFVDQLPIVSVYGDGRVITPGPTTSIYPGPALPNVLVRKVTADGVDSLVTRALDHGVGRDVDRGQVEIMDAPGTRFTVLTDSGLLVTDVYALDFTEKSRNLTDSQRSARRALLDLLDDLDNLPRTLGPDAGDVQPYGPTAIAAITRMWTEPASSSQPSQPERAWPGPTLPGGPMGHLPGLSCLTVAGADVTAVVNAAATANVATPWNSDGQRWRVRFRPLLPDETSCADLI